MRAERFRRREFLALLGAAAAWPLAARAQQRGQSARIGFLETTSREQNTANLSAFQKGLREFGHAEGKDLSFEYRSAEGRTERFPALAAELVSLNVDVIVTRGTPAALAAKGATPTIPIVMASSGDPLGSGLIARLARPGANITGLSALVLDLYPKRLELLRDIQPRLTHIAGIFDIDNPITSREWDEIAAASRALGIGSDLIGVRSRDDFVPAFNALAKQRVDALILGIDTLTQSNKELIAELAAAHRMPTIYAAREFADAGGLMAYGVSYPDLYYRAAAYVERIIKGAKPGDLPVQQPTKFELVVNLRAAKALDLNVPPILLGRADEVIE